MKYEAIHCRVIVPEEEAVFPESVTLVCNKVPTRVLFPFTIADCKDTL